MKAAHVGLAVLVLGWGLGLLGPAACGRDPLLDATGAGADGGPGAGGSGGLATDAGGTGGATGRGGAGGAPVDAGDAAVPSEVHPGEFPLVVLPADGPALPVGRSFRMRALVKLGATDSSWRDLGADPLLVWTIDDPMTAEITPKNGRVSGLSPGKTVVRANHPTFGNAQVPLVVTPSDIARVSLQPAALQLMIGQSQAMLAMASYQDGTTIDVTSAAVWATGDQRIARVENTLSPIGQVTGAASGNAIISADFAGVMGQATVLVSGNAPPTLSIAPTAASQTIGATSRFSAIFHQPAAPNSDVSAVATWSSSDPSVATWVGPTGQFRCLTPGSIGVTASFMGLFATAPLTCTAGAPILRALRLSLPNNGPLIVGISYGLGVDAIASDGMSTPVTDGKQVTWTTSDARVATIDTAPAVSSPTFIATLVGLAPGTVTITASYRGVSTNQDYMFIAR